MFRKKIILFGVVIFSITANAQSLETSSAIPTGYIATGAYNTGNTIMSVDGVLYMAYENMPILLLKYPSESKCTEFEVPSTVRRIANNAFQGAKNLKTLKLHAQVTDGNYIKPVFGETAFNDSGIEKVVVIEANSDTQKENNTTFNADVNNDGTVDISDVNAVIDIICGK